MREREHSNDLAKGIQPESCKPESVELFQESQVELLFRKGKS